MHPIVISPDEKCLLTGSADVTIRMWAINNKQQKGILKGNTDAVYSIYITDDSKYVVSGSLDKTIKIWNLKSTKKEDEINYNYQIFCVIITSDNK